jgi:hypothetical protein
MGTMTSLLSDANAVTAVSKVKVKMAASLLDCM